MWSTFSRSIGQVACYFQRFEANGLRVRDGDNYDLTNSKNKSNNCEQIYSLEKYACTLSSTISNEWDYKSANI